MYVVQGAVLPLIVRIDSRLHHGPAVFAFQAVPSAIVALLAAMSGGARYLTNDDQAIVGFLSGSYTGVPVPEGVFVNRVLSWLLASFYALIADLPWYGTALLATAALALVLGAAGCIRGLGLNCLWLAVSLPLLGFTALRPSFTGTALISGVMGILLLSRGRRLLVTGAGIVLIILSASWRLEGLFGAIAITLPVVAWSVLRDPQARPRVAAGTGLALIGIGLALWFSGSCLARDSCEAWQRFGDYTAARGLLHGDPRGGLADTGAVGWTPDARSLFFNFAYGDAEPFTGTAVNTLALDTPMVLKLAGPSFSSHLTIVLGSLLSSALAMATISFLLAWYLILTPGSRAQRLLACALPLWSLFVIVMIAAVRLTPAMAALAFPLGILAGIAVSPLMRGRTPGVVPALIGIAALAAGAAALLVGGSSVPALANEGKQLRSSLDAQRLELEAAANGALVFAEGAAADLLSVDPYGRPAFDERFVFSGWPVGSPAFSQRLGRFGHASVYNGLASSSARPWAQPGDILLFMGEGRAEETARVMEVQLGMGRFTPLELANFSDAPMPGRLVKLVRVG